jgi:hypothetical protein
MTTDNAFETRFTDESSDSPRRRKASADALAGREAAMLVRGLNRQLGLWQGASVKLHTMAQRLASSGRADPAIVEQVLRLFQTVSGESQRFEAMVGAQSPTVAQHSRITDTRQSFCMVVDRLRACCQLLGMEWPVE